MSKVTFKKLPERGHESSNGWTIRPEQGAGWVARHIERQVRSTHKTLGDAKFWVSDPRRNNNLTKYPLREGTTMPTKSLMSICVALYDEGGQSAVYDYINENHPEIKWGDCEPCETQSPIDPSDSSCLVCGSTMESSSEE